MSCKPTIIDVAKAAGVSLTTVSFVINGKADKHRIAAATQNRIRNIIRQLDYQPDPAARAVALGHYADYAKEHLRTPAEVIHADPIPEPVEPASPPIQEAAIIQTTESTPPPASEPDPIPESVTPPEQEPLEPATPTPGVIPEPVIIQEAATPVIIPEPVIIVLTTG